MAISNDVIVIGGGIAGMSAALAAAEEGADVRLLSAKQSTLRHASGLIDVLGYTPTWGESEGGEGPLADPFAHLSALPDSHPYRIVGESGIEAGLATFDDVAGDHYLGGHTDKNALVPTHGGTIKPTARYPRSSAAGLASDERDALLVGFDALTDFDAPLAADHLAAAGVPFETRGVTISFPGEFRADAKVTRFAHALDEDEDLDVSEGPGGTRVRGARAALADRIDEHLADEERVGLPAVLGETHHEAVRASLERALGVEVFEIPTGPPSLPGQRLEGWFHETLRAAGVKLTTSNPVVDAVGEDRVEAVILDKNGQEIPYAAEQFVLATGGLVGKGVDSARDHVEEPVFGCHVAYPEDRYDWSAADAFGDHEFARFGVEVDESLRPTDERGELHYENLRAAGSVLAGHDFAAEKSGSGVSLSTGVVAGETAGGEI